MPSTSKKQAKLMAAVAHNPAFAKKVGIPQSVGKKFNKADKSRKSKEGGNMAKDMSFAEQVAADNKVAKKDAEGKAKNYRTDAMMEGMHRMPDGKMMKDSAHKKPVKKMGGGAVKYRNGGSVSVKGYGMARGGRACKMA